MKKSIFFAMGLAAVMASCSSDDALTESTPVIDGPVADLVEDANGDVAGNDYRTIKLGLTTTGATTRGTGMVGGFTNETNKWNGQSLYVYMMKHGTMTPATFVDSEGNTSTIIKLYNNQEVIAPKDATGQRDAENGSNEAECADGSINYYPMVGDFDFYGYHIDDAGTGNPTVGQTAVTVPFTIDGSQDLMIGKTDFDTDKANPYKVNGSQGDGKVKEGRFYSAHAARHGVQPTLNFSHQLTRLTFEFAPGNAHAAGNNIDGLTEGIRITDVDVYTKVDGRMTVATTADVDEDALNPYITWTGDAKAVKIPDFKELDLSGKWTEETKTKTYTEESEGIIMAPVAGGDSVDVVLHVAQKVKTNNDGTMTEVTTQYPFKIAAPADGLLRGTSYKVSVTVYGLEDVQIYVTLDQWTKSDEIIEYDEEK